MLIEKMQFSKKNLRLQLTLALLDAHEETETVGLAETDKMEGTEEEVVTLRLSCSDITTIDDPFPTSGDMSQESCADDEFVLARSCKRIY